MHGQGQSGARESSPEQATKQLCNLAPVAYPLWASVSTSANWKLNRVVFKVLPCRELAAKEAQPLKQLPVGAVQAFNAPPPPHSPVQARETLNTPLRGTALPQPQPGHGSAPARGRPILPRAGLLKRRGTSRPSEAPTPTLLPNSPGRPGLSTSSTPANHAGPESCLRSPLLTALSRSETEAFTKPAQSALSSLRRSANPRTPFRCPPNQPGT